MMTVNTNWANPAKVSNQGYSWVHLGLHTLSMGYDITMALYNNNLLERIEMNPEYATDKMVQTIKDERLKHTISGALTGIGLIIVAISYIQNISDGNL
jgi:hypothetical protein